VVAVADLVAVVAVAAVVEPVRLYILVLPDRVIAAALAVIMTIQPAVVVALAELVDLRMVT
jgi:hypothetical protein